MIVFGKLKRLMEKLWSLPFLLISMTLLVLVYSLMHNRAGFLDKEIFNIACQLLEVTQDNNELVILRVPGPELRTLEIYPDYADLLQALFAKLPALNIKATVILLKQAPQRFKNQSILLTESILSEIAALNTKKNKQLKSVVQKAQQLKNYHGHFANVSSGIPLAIVMRVKANVNNDAKTGINSTIYDSLNVSQNQQSESSKNNDKRITVATITEQQDYLLHYFSQHLPDLPAIQELISFSTSTYSVLPTIEAQDDQLSYPLLWRHEDNVLPDAGLYLFKQLHDNAELSWDNQSQIATNNAQIIHTSLDGKFIPVNTAVYDVTDLDLSSWLDENYQPIPELLRLLNNKLLVIAESNDVKAGEIAKTFTSLKNRAYLYEPYWYHWLSVGLLITFLFYLLLLLPRLAAVAGILCTLLLIAILVFAQLGFVVVKMQWLPSGFFISYLLLGHSIMGLYMKYKRRIDQQTQKNYELRVILAKKQMDDAEYETAMENLKFCPANTQVMDLLYRVGIAFERKRDYDRAAEVYAYMVTQKRQYKDVQQRHQQLQSVHSVELQSIHPGQTLVMPSDAIQKPVLGRYQVDSELGRGAMGVVYLAHDPKISRQVAIKTLSYAQFDTSQLDSVKKRFFREAEAAGRLNHPNIVTVYDLGEENDLAFIAMDYVQGLPLSVYTKEEYLLPVETIYRITAEVAEALDYAHRQNVIHRDIKPANIMYNRDESKAKITDFGIARITDASRTGTANILGSPSYMSPEQLQGGNVDGRSDVFSLGVTFFQLLTGHLPFSGDNLPSLTYKIINQKPVSVRQFRPDLPASATRIINKCLQKGSDKRYQTALELANAIRRALKSMREADDEV